MNFIDELKKAKINESFNSNIVFEKKLTAEDINTVLHEISQYGTKSEMMYDDGRLYEFINELGNLIENINLLTLQETEDWFDKVSVSRDMKALQDNYKLMQKTAKELKPLRERIANCYDSIGIIIDRYYEIGDN